jgi:adenylylsulfate kinase
MAKIFGQRSATLWFTGLRGSGKSILAFPHEYILLNAHYKTYVLDGDNVRHGLTKNLDFPDDDHDENIRRIGGLSMPFADAGLLALSRFISAFRKDRQLVRKIHEDAILPFIEVFVDILQEVTEKRDPKQLYIKALCGEITNFTGIGSLHEILENADMNLVYLKLHGLIRG